MPKTYTVKQVADILGYSTNSIYTFLKEGRLKGVRVGKGRFRIPQADVDMLIHARTAAQAAPVGGVVAPQVQETLHLAPQAAPIQAQPSEQDMPAIEVRLDKLPFPSFFDWFVLMVSTILGTSLILFSRNIEKVTVSNFDLWQIPIQVSFIAGAVGYMLNRLQRKDMFLWKMVFVGILVFAYVSFSILLLLSGQSAIAYLVIAFAVLLSLFIPASSSAWLLLIDVLLSLGYTLAFFAFPTLLPWGTDMFSIVDPSIFYVLVGVFFIGLSAITLYSYHRLAVFFRLSTGLKSVIYIVLAISYAQQSHWGISLLLSIFSLFFIFLPLEEKIWPIRKQMRTKVYVCFAAVLGVFLLAIGMIRVMQLNRYEYTQHELAAKVRYGKSVVESTIESAQTALEYQAKDSAFISALSHKDLPALQGMVKNTFLVNGRLRQVIVLDMREENVSSYPLVASQSSSYDVQEYFGRVRLDYKTVVAYGALSSTQKDNSIVIAIPVVNEKFEFIGALIGTIDMSALDNKLQSFFSVNDQSGMVLIDARGVRMIPEEIQLADKELDQDDPMRLGLQGLSGASIRYTPRGNGSINVYEPVTSRGWVIGARQSIETAYGTSKVGMIVIFVAVGITMIVVMVLLTDYQSSPLAQKAISTISEDTS